MLDVITLFSEILGDKMDEYDLPTPSFEIMKCEIIEFNVDE